MSDRVTGRKSVGRILYVCMQPRNTTALYTATFSALTTACMHAWVQCLKNNIGKFAATWLRYVWRTSETHRQLRVLRYMQRLSKRILDRSTWRRNADLTSKKYFGHVTHVISFLKTFTNENDVIGTCLGCNRVRRNCFIEKLTNVTWFMGVVGKCLLADWPVQISIAIYIEVVGYDKTGHASSRMDNGLRRN